MKVIGFANQYYTLWNVSEPYREYVSEHSWYMKVDCQYIQNLSKDLEAAKAKLTGEYRINLELRGEKGWSFSERVGGKQSSLLPYQFPEHFYGYVGQDIRTIEDEAGIKMLWVLYMKKEIWDNSVEEHNFKNLNPHWVKPVVYARRRLVELGKLIRYKGKYYSPKYLEIVKAKEEIVEQKSALEHGSFFTEGARIDLEVKEIDRFNFESKFGTTFIQTLATSCGKLVKYMGASPIDIANDTFTKIKATIKHSEYNGVNETKLQRIKLI